MIRILISIAIGIFIFGCNTVLAAKNYSSVKIQDVIVNTSTGIHFRIDVPMEDNESCGSNAWFKVASDSAYEKEAFSILLAYEAQNKLVTVHVSGCTGGYPKLNYIH